MIYRDKKSLVNINLIFLALSFLLIIYSTYLVITLGIYHAELDIYLPHYLSDKPVLNIIFDPICELDITRSFFRGREIGSFFNLIDSRLLLMLFDYGFGQFISIVNLIALLLLVFSLVAFNWKSNNTEKSIIYLLGLLYLSSPPIVFSEIFYRTNKVIASVAIYFTIMIIYEFRKFINNQKFFLLSILLLISELIACLSDEQGFAIIILIAVFVGLNAFKYGKSNKIILSITVLALITAFLYKKYLGVEIFKAINGITPIELSMNGQNFLSIDKFFDAYRIFVKYISYFYGNLFYQSIHQVSIYTGIAIFIILILIIKRKINLYIFINFLIAVGLLIYMLNIMILKHAAILWEDMITYYNIPIVTFIFSISVICIKNNKYIKINPKNKFSYFLIFILMALNISNMISINKNKQKIINGHLNYYMNGEIIISAIYGSFKDLDNKYESIELKNYVPGARSDMQYSKAGTEVIRKLINKKNTKND